MNTRLPAVSYQVKALDLHAHLFEVRLTVAQPAPDQVVSLPVWIPGSYLVREFSKHLQGLSANQRNKHKHQRHDGQQPHQFGRLFLRLKLPTQCDEVALGQLGLRHYLADVFHDLGQRTALRVGRQHDAAFAIITADLVGAITVFNRRHFG